MGGTTGERGERGEAPRSLVEAANLVETHLALVEGASQLADEDDDEAGGDRERDPHAADV